MFLSVWRGQKVKNVQDNYLVNARIDDNRLDRAGMPRVTLPKADQEARWVPRSEIAAVGLDRHNRDTIEQGLERLKGVSQPVR